MTRSDTRSYSAMDWIFIVTSSLLRFLVYILTPIVTYFQRENPPRIPPVKNPLLKLSASTLAKRIRSREISSLEVVEAYIERIKEVNPILNAVIEDRFDEARKEARICDENIKNAKISLAELEKKKPLYGVPFTVKESCGLQGLSQTGGSLIRQGIKAITDGEAVEMMKNAGGIPLCVTNTPELCTSFDSANYLFGRTLNSYDCRYTAGGSSGGEAALVGAGASLIGIGSDIGGSIRVPAHFNGIFGHKPTTGLVPIKGHFPYSDDPDFQKFLVLGPLARYAEDLHLSMKILGAKSIRDLRLDEPVDLKKLNVYYLEDIGQSVALIPVISEIRTIVKKAAMYLEERGATVKEYPKGSLLYVVQSSLAALFSIKKFPQLLLDPNDPKHEKEVLYEIPKALLGLSQYTKSAILMKLLVDMNCFIKPSNLPQLKLKAEKAKNYILDILGDNGVFILPTFPTAAPIGKMVSMYITATTYCIPWNIYGFPSSNVPMGFDKEGMPIGLQVIAAPYQDRLCLAVAKELEKNFGGWINPHLD